MRDVLKNIQILRSIFINESIFLNNQFKNQSVTFSLRPLDSGERKSRVACIPSHSPFIHRFCLSHFPIRKSIAGGALSFLKLPFTHPCLFLLPFLAGGFEIECRRANYRPKSRAGTKGERFCLLFGWRTVGYRCLFTRPFGCAK